MQSDAKNSTKFNINELITIFTLKMEFLTQDKKESCIIHALNFIFKFTQ